MALPSAMTLLLLVSLCLSGFAKPGAHVNQTNNPPPAPLVSSGALPNHLTEPSKIVTVSPRAENTGALPNKLPSKIVSVSPRAEIFIPENPGLSYNEKEGRMINFALAEINNGTTLRYKERVDEVLQAVQNRRNAELYHLKLRLTRSQCQKENSSCDVSYDPLFAKKTEYDPFIAPLEPLKPGRVVVVEGGIPLKSNGFDITIQTGVERSVAAQLRLSARFSEEGNALLLKHFDGCWNLDKHYEDILQPTTNFTLSITCLSTHFEIAVNDHILDKFHHVLPYIDATHLAIQGEVDISSVEGAGQQLPNKKYANLPAWRKDDVKYQIPSYVPFTAPLDMPLRPGKVIQIKGRTHSRAKWFSVYIQSGSNDDEVEAVQLRLQSRFENSSKKVELEYFDGTWSGQEIYDQIMTAGHSFKIVITCLSKQFKISINDKDFAHYDHKIPYEKASHLRIEGRVNITEVIGIDKLPAIQSFNPPALAEPLPALPLHDLPLTPGRRIKVWASIPKNSSSFEISLRNSEKSLFALGVGFSLSNGKWDLTLRNLQKSVSGTLQKNAVDWIQAGDPLQMEIEYTDTLYHVRFFNNWEYSYNSTQVPISNITELALYGNLLVHGVTGLRNGPDTPPAAPSQPARVCKLNVWSSTSKLQLFRDLWFNGLECVDESPSAGNATSSEEL